MPDFPVNTQMPQARTISLVKFQISLDRAIPQIAQMLPNCTVLLLNLKIFLDAFRMHHFPVNLLIDERMHHFACKISIFSWKGKPFKSLKCPQKAPFWF